MGLVIHVDGGSRGNPGPAGAGVVIQDDAGQLVYEAGFFLGRQTNNADVGASATTTIGSGRVANSSATAVGNNASFYVTRPGS